MGVTTPRVCRAANYSKKSVLVVRSSTKKAPPVPEPTFPATITRPGAFSPNTSPLLFLSVLPAITITHVAHSHVAALLGGPDEPEPAITITHVAHSHIGGGESYGLELVNLQSPSLTSLILTRHFVTQSFQGTALRFASAPVSYHLWYQIL